MRLLFALCVTVGVLAFGAKSHGQNTNIKLPPVNKEVATCNCAKKYVTGSFCSGECFAIVIKKSGTCKAGCSLLPVNPYLSEKINTKQLQSTSGVTGN